MANEVKIKLTDAQRAKIKSATGKDMSEIRVGSLGKNPAVSATEKTLSARVVAKQSAFRLTAAKQSAMRVNSAKQLSAKQLSAKQLSAKQLSAKQLSAKQLSAKQLSAKQLSAKQTT
jgi:hypothetical protein